MSDFTIQPGAHVSSSMFYAFETDTSMPWLKWYDNLKIHATKLIPNHIHDRIGPDDMVQETMLAATLHSDKLNGKTDNEILGWLVVTLRNRTRYAIRQASATSRNHPTGLRETQASENLWQNIATDESGMESRLTRAEHLSMLRTAFSRLEKRDQDLIRWRYHDRRKFAWIAFHLEISERHTRRLFQSTLEKFRQEFLDCIKSGYSDATVPNELFSESKKDELPLAIK